MNFTLGGYIGITIGYSAAQAPDIIAGFVAWIKDLMKFSSETRLKWFLSSSEFSNIYPVNEEFISFEIDVNKWLHSKSLRFRKYLGAWVIIAFNLLVFM